MKNQSFIKRTKRTENFTIINNEIVQCKNLSFEAKGVLVYILSLPDDWIVHKTVLQKEFSVSRRFVDSVFKEIEDAGYMCSVEMAREKGKFTVKHYFFYDECMKPNEINTSNHCSKTVDGLPTTANVQLQSTNITKELILQNNTHSASENFKNSSAIDSKELKLNNRLKKIKGSVAERFKAFSDLVYKQAKNDKVSSEVAEQLINKYGADDADFEGYMRFETDRFWDLQLKLRQFEKQQEKFDEKYS